MSKQSVDVRHHSDPRIDDFGPHCSGDRYRAVRWPEGAPDPSTVPGVGTPVRWGDIDGWEVEGARPYRRSAEWRIHIVRRGKDGDVIQSGDPLLEDITVIPDEPERRCLKCGKDEEWRTCSSGHYHRFADERSGKDRRVANRRPTCGDVAPQYGRRSALRVRRSGDERRKP